MKRKNLSQRQRVRIRRGDITLHLPVWMINRIRSVANDCSVPCEDVIKIWVAEKVLDREKTSLRRVHNGH